MPKPKLMIVIASTRPGRIGAPVGEWFHKRAIEHADFDVQVVDLAELDLPFVDEPNHPRLRMYTKEHTKRWSALVDAAEAFVFVTPEYNYGMPPSLLNALDFLHHEWNYKPVAFVSYGGVSAGTRSVQMAKQIVTTLKMMPLPEGVQVPFVTQFLENGVFKPNTTLEDAATTVLSELLRWTQALRPMRQQTLATV